ncbi:MAG: hypothetical protein A2070_10600 [Bdellovibrionales bacterium GWC1_52_8]|nr:MAG: hypothetical protein A2Z97_01325 [Bdellovibrionales bacterium GWB1_52_6]OFZ04973.1 MAG: hypothetical protein A2X97_00030 [Bdellovibrionales bacterium GWA1_52_35]OFZ42570.1 MAG: hypothetical protein A2070_10600 [Bdellovibrionales bacterium GWC1_52_8]
MFLIVTASAVVLGLGDALVPLLIASFTAYLLLPLVRKLESRGIRRELAVSVAMAIAVVLGAVAITLLVPVLVKDLRAFLDALPRIAEAAIHKVEGVATRFGVDLPLSKEELTVQVTAFLAELPVGALKSVGVFFGKTLTGIVGLILGVLNLLLIPIFLVYLIADHDRLGREIRALVPPRNRAWFDSFLSRSNQILGAYFRGQLLVAAILGVIYGLGFWAVGLRFGFVIGLLTGFLNVIPYAGPLIGLGLASIVALANFEGIIAFASVWVVFAVVQGLEGFVITPRIVGDRVGLNALETMIALIVGGNLGGFVGMLIAIPVAGIMKFLLNESKTRYLKSDLYSDGNG